MGNGNQPGPLPERGSVEDERRIASWIGGSIVIKGDITCSKDLNIDGHVEGTIEVGDHGLIIGVGAAVKADLVARTVTISGAVTGNVRASEKVELRAMGSVDGDIMAPRFAMAEGAIVKGRVDVGGTSQRTDTGAGSR